MREHDAGTLKEISADNLLFDLFQDRVTGLFVSGIPELGLEFAEHPCSPRLAVAKLDQEGCLPRLAEEVASLTTWVIFQATRREDW